MGHDSPSASFAVVMPIHRAHFSYAALFVDSLHWCEAGDDLVFFPVFQTDSDMLSFTDLMAGREHLPTEPLVLRPDGRNPVTSQKWRALRLVFNEHPAVAYALTLDAESALITTANGRHLREWFFNWSAQRTVLGSSWLPRVSSKPSS